MVCLGNICRSPLAQGILEHKVKLHRLDWQVDSAGTGSWHAGEPPDIRSQEVARAHGIDISAQRARPVRSTDWTDYELVYCMDSHNYSTLMALAQNEKERAKIKLILNEIAPPTNAQVPDPYHGGSDGFEQVYQLLDRACDAIIVNQSKRQ
jgi:protein-tyrosine phosphatase